jgi:hypothetical protein
MIKTPVWMPVWALPNVTLGGPIEASHAALVPWDDQRIYAVARRRPSFEAFIGAFQNEFGTRVCPTVGIVREDAPDTVKDVTAFGAFRDAICLSAIDFFDAICIAHDGVLFDRAHRLAGHPGEDGDLLFEGHRLSGEAPMLQRILVASRSAATSPVHAADARALHLRRSPWLG